jgi:hypothetical protein
MVLVYYLFCQEFLLLVGYHFKKRFKIPKHELFEIANMLNFISCVNYKMNS